MMQAQNDHAQAQQVRRFEVGCTRCPGTGIIPPKRAGTDWPERCACEGRQTVTHYELGRILGECPKTLLRLSMMRVRDPAVAARLLDKITAFAFGPVHAA